MDFTDIVKNIKCVKNSKQESFALVPLNFFMELVEDFADVEFSKLVDGEPRTSLDDLELELIQDGKLQD